MTHDDLTGFERFQLEKYGNILGKSEVMPNGECEQGEEERRRYKTWVELHEVLQEYEQL